MVWAKKLPVKQGILLLWPKHVIHTTNWCTGKELECNTTKLKY